MALSGIPMIALRSLRQHLVSTCITAFSTALGVGLVIAVFLLGSQSERAFSGGPVGFDAVLLDQVPEQFSGGEQDVVAVVARRGGRAAHAATEQRSFSGRG